MDDLLPPTRMAVLEGRLRAKGYALRLERDHIAVVEPLHGGASMMHASVKLKPPIEELSAWQAVMGLLVALNLHDEIPGLHMTIKAELTP